VGCRKAAADDTNAIAKTVRMPIVRITLSCPRIVLQTLHRGRGSCVLMPTRRTEHGDAAEGGVPVRWCAVRQSAAHPSVRVLLTYVHVLDFGRRKNRRTNTCTFF
jgi:hypothetical protein